MSDTPEYILKAGVTISDDILLWGPNMVAITVRDEQGIYRGSMERALYERAFVPLDRQALTKQLEDILEKFWQDEDQDLDDSVAEVLSLLGMKGKE